MVLVVMVLVVALRCDGSSVSCGVGGGGVSVGISGGGVSSDGVGSDGVGCGVEVWW